MVFCGRGVIDTSDEKCSEEVAMRIDENTIKTITSIAKEYGATQMFLFGGALESPADARDIDLACGGVTGWKLFELAAQLEDTLHINFDLVSMDPSSRFTRHIEANGKRLI
jgi:predicted nucleotidyltransferase